MAMGGYFDSRYLIKNNRIKTLIMRTKTSSVNLPLEDRMIAYSALGYAQDAGHADIVEILYKSDAEEGWERPARDDLPNDG